MLEYWYRKEVALCQAKMGSTTLSRTGNECTRPRRTQSFLPSAHRSFHPLLTRMDKLRQVAGAAAPTATSLDDMLEGDFDPDEWDKKMSAAFNDDYYGVRGPAVET